MSLTPLGARGQVGYGLGVTGVSGFTPSDVTQAEADALIALYDATGGDDWTDNTGWKTDPIVGNWYGVTVSGGHVTQVILRLNNLTGFSEEWDGSDLSLLTILYLYINPITDISGITWPGSLTDLNLRNNSITDISEVTWPDSLMELRLYNNSITDISEVIWPSSLTTLYLYGNSITDISGVDWPDSLETLDLSDNSITDISETWPNSLRKLYLSNNSITDISETWPNSLRKLYLSNNSITDISEVTWSESLEILYLDRNSITDISETWPDSLTILRLDRNSITDISEVTWPDSLAELRLHYNSMSQANIDLFLSQIYNQRMGFTDASPYGYIGGTNAEPSGTYQYAVAPSTGKEYMYALENDDDGEGFSIWDFDLDYS